MKKFSLNNDWEYTEGTLRNPLMIHMLSGWKKCRLPHDAQILKERDPAAPSEDNEGWTQGAAVYYRKSFAAEPEAIGKRCWLEFEGIAGACEIWVNQQFVAKHLNPYTGVIVEITELLHAGENSILVHADSRMKPCSRWYVGTGLYRRVWLHMGENITVPPEGLRVTTRELDGRNAALDITAELTGPADAVAFTLRDSSGNAVGRAAAAVEGNTARAQLRAEGITPWCPEHPALYTVEASVEADGVTDTATVRTGIRTISVDPENGFRLNSAPMKLKGGCIHHDLGLLGAAEYKDADRRRVRILKENGFNALRGAHNPFGPAFYEVCDELGMLVIEEAFDEWVLGRTDFGLHVTFEDRWEQDLEDMIRRDYNHPSIVMWSTGNEVEERDGSAGGYDWSRRLAEKVRSLDATRPVSASACSLFVEYTQQPGPGAAGATGNQALNMAYDAFAEGRDLWGPATEPYFAPLDVAGYNYKVARYEYDHEKFPSRVIYGSESYPRAALESWRAAERNPHVIGDFVWTAWDYIGEVGVGRWEVSDQPRPAGAGYPWLLAYCGDFDFLGNKRPQSNYRDVVWGNAKGPKLFCLPPELTAKPIARLSWGWLPVQRNYTFPGAENQEAEVHIYADAGEVELFQNGISMGKQSCTESEKFEAVFTVPYRPGTLEAAAYLGGKEIGRDVLQTAGQTARLLLSAEPGSEDALCFVEISAVDGSGVPVFGETEAVTVTVTGGGELLALGTADPKPDRRTLFSGETCPLFEGKAMAVIRAVPGGGVVSVRAALENGAQGEVTIPCPDMESAADLPVHDVVPGPLDLPLGQLLENEAARDVLNAFPGPVLSSPMLESMKGMSLKKLLSMSGGRIPPELETALSGAVKIS